MKLSKSPTLMAGATGAFILGAVLAFQVDANIETAAADPGSSARARLAPASPAEATQFAQAQPQRERGKGRGKGGRKGGRRSGGTPDGKRKPSISDTLKANIYADNSFVLYINGKLVAVDSIEFIPHNVVSVDILPEYPMTIAVLAKDNAHREKGTEYVNNIGDGGFILKIGSKILTSSAWKAKNFFHGPINGDVNNPRVKHTPIPNNWFAPDFDDSQWASAKQYTEEEIGPKGPFYEHDFNGAKFIWSDDLKLDNTVIFRFKIDGPKADFYTGR